MKFRIRLPLLYLLGLSLMVLLTSCIQDEAPNAEADILTVVLPGINYVRAPVIETMTVKCVVDSTVDLTALAPEFTLTEGATIYPESGTLLDFSLPQFYIVTSQDGFWSKKYVVSIQRLNQSNDTSSELTVHYNFETIETVETDQEGGAYHLFVEHKGEKDEMIWGSGNAGFAITNSGKSAQEFPSYQDEEGYEGKCVVCETRSTGSLGEMFGSPLVPGNLFLGVFALDLSNPLKSTHFGIPMTHKIGLISGYYTYKSGEIYRQYTDETGYKSKDYKILDRLDSGEVYAVVYEVSEETPYLDGTNVRTSDQILALSSPIAPFVQTNTWQPFVLKMNWIKPLDEEKLKNGNYNIVLVLSSSVDADIYNGAVGSTLKVDNISLEYE